MFGRNAARAHLAFNRRLVAGGHEPTVNRLDYGAFAVATYGLPESEATLEGISLEASIGQLGLPKK